MAYRAMHATTADANPAEPAGTDTSGRGAALRAARQARCMTQDILAGAAGVSARTVLRAERGEDISKENLRAICSVLGLDAASLPGAAPPDAPARPERRWPAWRPGKWTRRLLALAALTVALNVTNGVIGWNQDWESMGRAMSLERGRFLAVRANAVIAAVARGEEPSQADVAVSRDIVMFGCEPPHPSGWVYGQLWSCTGSTMRVTVLATAPGSASFTVGPVSDALFESFVLQLRRDPGVAVRVALVPDGQPPRAGTLRFDPRGVDPRELPRVSPGRAHLNVEIQREGTRP